MNTFYSVASRVADHVRFSGMPLTKEEVEYYLEQIDVGVYLDGDTLVVYPHCFQKMPYSDFENLVKRFLNFKRPFL